MIPSRTLHLNFRLKANQGDNGFLKKLSVAQVDQYLNEASDILFANLTRNVELNSEIRNSLRQLEVKNIHLPVSNFEKYSIMQFPTDYYKMIRSYAVATKTGCSMKREINIHITQSEDLNESLKSPYWTPSFAYEETLADEGSDGLYVWHNGEFKIESVCIDYIRKMNRIACPSLVECGFYRDENGNTVSADSPYEVDSTFDWRAVVDIAILMAKRDKGDMTNYQSQLQLLLGKDKLF